MGRGDHVVHAEQRIVAGDGLLFPHVERGARQPLLGERPASARSSTTGPRAVLMSMAVGFMRRKKVSLMRWRVSALSSVWTDT